MVYRILFTCLGAVAGAAAGALLIGGLGGGYLQMDFMHGSRIPMTESESRQFDLKYGNASAVLFLMGALVGAFFGARSFWYLYDRMAYWV